MTQFQKALDYMRACLSQTCQPPDRRENVLNWDAFEAHMLAAWIRMFVPDDPMALPVAKLWGEIISQSFLNGEFNSETYAAIYRKYIPVLNKGERLIMVPQFYMVNLLKGMLGSETESRFIDYIINHDTGIYYVYGKRIVDLPNIFASRQTNDYIAALEQIAGYACAGKKLRFAADWLKRHMDENSKWDLGVKAKDGIYFPLSDSWHKPEDRKRDCTLRIRRLFEGLER